MNILLPYQDSEMERVIETQTLKWKENLSEQDIKMFEI